MSQIRSRSKLLDFAFDNSLFLIGGTLLALVWANLDGDSYSHFTHFDFTAIFNSHGEEHAVLPHGSEHAAVTHGSDAGHHETAGHAQTASHSSHGLTIHFLINDILMALFFAIAGKEVWESLLPGGAMSNFRKAGMPLFATLGGIVAPAAVFFVGAFLIGQSGFFGQEGQLGRGWAIPCATDIAFSFLVARLIFGAGHPAVSFLLLLAIADDAAGLAILATMYPQHPLHLSWLLLAVGAIGVGFVLRKQKVHSFWWYLLIPGTMSWLSFYFAGLHPALGLLPIIPCMPHAKTDLGLYAKGERQREDTLNAFEHWFKNPVEVILGLFGLVNAGVAFGNMGAGTWLVLLGLIVGKPLGIAFFAWIADKVFKLELPAGMDYRHVFTLGAVAGIGLTVALFVTTAAYPAGVAAPDGSILYPATLIDSLKMGALLSFAAGPLAFWFARAVGIRPLKMGTETTADNSASASDASREDLQPTA